MEKYRTHSIVFITGATIMVQELLGTRIIAPYLGLSLIVWTSIIGVILAALAVGYALGGHLADKNQTSKTLSLILASSGAIFIFVALLKDIVPSFAAQLGPFAGSLISACILFLPSSILLAMVTPFAVKLELQRLDNSGTTTGNLYAVSTVGSIVGTFVAGFLLIPNFTTTNILLGLAIVLLIGSFVIKRPQTIALLSCVIAIIGTAFFSYAYDAARHVVAFSSSAYAPLTIIDRNFQGHPARFLIKDVEVQSGQYLDSDDLLAAYSKFFTLDEYFHPKPERALLLGGGAYSMAKNFLQRFPEGKIDVVEIDPKVTELAKKYFGLQASPNLTNYTEDARFFLNRRQSKYDIIYNDSFSSYFAVPYQLTTEQAVQAMSDNLNSDGVVIVNVISSLGGRNAAFFASEYRTFQAVFPHVYAYAVQSTTDQNVTQNIVLVGVKNPHFSLSGTNEASIINFLSHEVHPVIPSGTPILTDEFAPVDYYVASLQPQRTN